MSIGPARSGLGELTREGNEGKARQTRSDDVDTDRLRAILLCHGAREA